MPTSLGGNTDLQVAVKEFTKNKVKAVKMGSKYLFTGDFLDTFWFCSLLWLLHEQNVLDGENEKGEYVKGFQSKDVFTSKEYHTMSEIYNQAMENFGWQSLKVVLLDRPDLPGTKQYVCDAPDYDEYHALDHLSQYVLPEYFCLNIQATLMLDQLCTFKDFLSICSEGKIKRPEYVEIDKNSDNKKTT